MYSSIYPFHTGVQIVLGSPRDWDYSRFINGITAVFSYMNVCHLAKEFSLLELGSIIEIWKKAYIVYTLQYKFLTKLPEYKTVSLITLGVWFSITRFINGIMMHQSIWHTVGSQVFVNLNFIPPG